MKCETPDQSISSPQRARVGAGTEARRAAKRIPVHISGTTVPDCSCELVGIDAGILYVRSERQIQESSPIIVSFDHVQLSGVVAGCQPDEREWVISVALASCKRRLEERVATGEKCVVGIVENEGTTLRRGRVIDESSAGMGLLLTLPIDMGARIYVETESMMVFGEVRHCRLMADGHYTAGIMIVEVVPDLRSQNMFSVMLNNLRWKLASSIRGKDVPAYRQDH